MQGKIYLVATVANNVICFDSYDFDLDVSAMNTLIETMKDELRKAVDKAQLKSNKEWRFMTTEQLIGLTQFVGVLILIWILVYHDSKQQ